MFGLHSASGFYQEVMIGILSRHPKLEKCSCAHLDDVIIGTETIEEHYEALEILFNILREINIKMYNLQCSFLQENDKTHRI